MNRSEAAQIIKNHSSKRLWQEIQNLQADEDTGDIVQCFVFVADHSEEGLLPFVSDCNRVLKALGALKQVSEEELQERIQTSLGIKKSHFPKIGGARHEVVMSHSDIEELKD